MKYETTTEIRTKAEASFARLMGYTFIAAILTVTAALLYLGRDGGLSAGTAFVIGFAVFLSVMLGAGLMAIGFFSSNVGHDERASGHYEPTSSEPTSDE